MGIFALSIFMSLNASALTLDVSQSVKLVPGFYNHQITFSGPQAVQIFDAMKSPLEVSYIDGEEGLRAKNLDGLNCTLFRDDTCSVPFTLENGIQMKGDGRGTSDLTLLFVGNLNGLEAFLYELLPAQKDESALKPATRKLKGMSCTRDMDKAETRCSIEVDTTKGIVTELHP